MHINSSRLKKLRQERQWSQDQLAKLTGLNLRTIQRLEAGSKISTESLRALASVFEVPTDSLLTTNDEPSQSALNAMHKGLSMGLEFKGTTNKHDFWWFTLAIVIFLAMAKILALILGTVLFQLASLVALLPWLAACARRLRDAGLSPWWQLMMFVPVAGIIVLLYLLSFNVSSSAKNGSR